MPGPPDPTAAGTKWRPPRSAYHHPLHGAPDNEGRDPSGSGHRAPAPYQHWVHESQRRALLEFPVRSGAKSDRDGFRGLSTTPPLQGLPRRRGGSRLFKVLLWKVLKSRLVRKVGERKTSTFEKDTPGTPEVRENNAGNARFMIPTGPILTASS